MEAWERERKRHQDEEEARRVRAQKKRKKREKASAEKQARIARSRRRQLHVYPPRKREVTGPAACPSCRSGERLYSIEHLTGYARGTARIESGVAHFDHEGTTEVDWDSSATAGFACDCGWRGGLDDLVLA